jgi:hypothetical protein
LAAVEAEQAAEAEAEEAAASPTQPEPEPAGGEVFCPLATDNSCTPEEKQEIEAAESLCGGGTAEGRAEAAEMGIDC